MFASVRRRAALLAALALLTADSDAFCAPAGLSSRSRVRGRVTGGAVVAMSSAPTTTVTRPEFTPSPAKVAELSEQATKDMLDRLEAAPLALPAPHDGRAVEASFVRTRAAAVEGVPPLVLLHGFDSSCLEFRRMLPELEALGVEAYALDLLGWGFGATGGAVSVEAKRAALLAFQRDVLGGRPAALLGVSLGAAVLIDFHAAHPDAVAAALLVDPQGFIDGAPPVPERFARGGIRVLGSWPLRSLANQIAYYDKETCATDDAIRVGLLHTARPAWEDDSVAWLLGGGYSVSSLVPRLAGTPTAILWGRQDEILPPAEYAPKFVAALPGAAFRWVEECGHSPHLEQAATLARAVRTFLDDGPDALAGDADVSELVRLANRSPLEKLSDGWGELNAALDAPLLDANVRGGPLEPVKKWVRSEPELAQVAASVLALSFFFVLFRAFAGVLFG